MMSIEQNLAALTAAVIELTAAMRGNAQTATVTQAAPVAQAPIATAPVMQMPAPPVFAPPAAPMFAAPAPAVSAPTSQSAPFNDGTGLIGYVMAAYKEMGPQKGALIQQVLTTLGYNNINDVKPEHYAQLFTGVEQLKRG